MPHGRRFTRKDERLKRRKCWKKQSRNTWGDSAVDVLLHVFVAAWGISLNIVNLGKKNENRVSTWGTHSSVLFTPIELVQFKEFMYPFQENVIVLSSKEQMPHDTWQNIKREKASMHHMKIFKLKKKNPFLWSADDWLCQVSRTRSIKQQCSWWH